MDQERKRTIENDIDNWIKLERDMESHKDGQGFIDDQQGPEEEKQVILKDRLYRFRPKQYVLDVINILWRSDKYKNEKKVRKLIWEIETLLRSDPEHDYTFEKALESRLKRATPEQLALFEEVV